MMGIKKAVLVLMHVIVITANAQQDSLRSIFSYGATLHKGFIFAHSREVQNTANSYPTGFQIDFNWQLADAKTWNTCYCYPKTGFFIQYFNFDNQILGHAITSAAFIEPFFSFAHRINMSIKAAAGLSYLTNPYHPLSNPNNLSYSLPITGFVSLGLGTHVKLSERLSMSAYIHYNHVSNGGIKDPNKGVNWPTAALGIDYRPIVASLPVREKTKYKNYKGKLPRVDMSVFWSSKTVQAGEKDRWMIGGITAQVSKQTGIFNALTLGAEWNIDNSLRERLKRNGKSDISNQRAAITVGHEFLMGKIIFSQQLGVYLFNPSGYFDPVFQRYGLLYRLSDNWGIGMNVLAHRQVANFLDFRIIYSL